MAVYVDDMMTCIPNANWRWSKSCHMIADNVHELHEFAKLIGMRRSWFQRDSRLPHYDLTERRRLDRRGFVGKMHEIQSTESYIAGITGIPAHVLNLGYDQTKSKE